MVASNPRLLSDWRMRPATRAARPLLTLSLMAWLLFIHPDAAVAQVRGGASALNLIVTIGGHIGQAPVLGAGVIVARERNRLHIATANHVVRRGGAEATDLQVRLESAPNIALSARLLPFADAAFDLAVLTVDSPAGIDPCALTLDIVAAPATIVRGRDVYPVGNPNGVPWVLPVRPDAIADVRDDRVVFQSTVLAQGHSGGGLLDGEGRLIALIQSDEPPFGRALDVRKLVAIL